MTRSAALPRPQGREHLEQMGFGVEMESGARIATQLSDAAMATTTSLRRGSPGLARGRPSQGSAWARPRLVRRD